jgi:hypothetical protein
MLDHYTSHESPVVMSLIMTANIIPPSGHLAFLAVLAGPVVIGLLIHALLCLLATVRYFYTSQFWRDVRKILRDFLNARWIQAMLFLDRLRESYPGRVCLWLTVTLGLYLVALFLHLSPEYFMKLLQHTAALVSALRSLWYEDPKTLLIYLSRWIDAMPLVGVVVVFLRFVLDTICSYFYAQAYVQALILSALLMVGLVLAAALGYAVSAVPWLRIHRKETWAAFLEMWTEWTRDPREWWAQFWQFAAPAPAYILASPMAPATVAAATASASSRSEPADEPWWCYMCGSNTNGCRDGYCELHSTGRPSVATTVRMLRSTRSKTRSSMDQ